MPLFPLSLPPSSSFSPAFLPSDSLRNRNTATSLCLLLNQRASPGLSGTNDHAQTATNKLGKPSIRNNNRQGAHGPPSPSFVINQASVLAKDVDSGAAEMKRPVRKASSSRRKKNDR